MQKSELLLPAPQRHRSPPFQAAERWRASENAQTKCHRRANRHSRGLKAALSSQPTNFLARMLALWPPKPKELLRMALTVIWRAVFGT